MSLTERIYGKETAGKPAVSSDTRKNLYTAAANKKPSLANRIAQNGGQPTLYADAAAKQKPSLASRIEANGGTPYADAAAQMKSGNAAKGTSVVFNSVYGKADDRASSAGSGKYAGILKASDYTELSKSGESKRKLFGDARYDYINNIGNFRAQSDVQQAQGRGQDYGKYAFMTDDEIGVYNYLYATQGKKAANAFLSDLEPELDKQWYTGTNRATTEALGKNAATRTLASAMTVAAQPARTITSMIAMADDAVRTVKGQEINPYSKWRQASNITQELRADTSQHIEETNPGMGGKVGSFVYNTAMSAADSAMNALVAKGIGEAVGLTGDTLMKATNILGSALMSSEAASLSIAESKEKGYSNAGALALGLTRGAIEYASEAVGGEWVIRKIKANPLSFVKSMALTMIPEGMEEVMSDAANGVVNLAIDAAFGTEESGIPKMLEYYRTSGTDWQKKHAELATVLAVLGQEGLSFLGGALATLGSSGVQYSTNRANINQTAERLDTTPKNVVQMMQDAQTENPGVIYALAELTDAENADDLRQKIGTKEDMKRAAEYLTQQMGASGRSGAQEGTYIAGTQNAPAGAQRAQNEVTIPQSAAPTAPFAQGSRNMKGEFGNGQSTYQGRENGSYDLRTGGQAAAEGGAQALAGGRAEVPGGVGADAQTDLRKVTPAQLGIRNGGTEAVTVVDARKLGGDAARAYNLLAANNIEPVAVRGAIQVNNGYANAYTESGRVFFRVDAVDSRGNAISPEALVRHELFHNYISEEVLQASDEVIRESMTAEEYDAMYESYRDAYASIYDFENMSEDEIERLLTEEIAADAYAGLNWFSGDAPVQKAVRAETERNAPTRRAEAQQETTGPPGRATAAGIGARTADSAALRRAEALEKSGTDNETIRQETGWYRGMDGQWRFEIDDSGATFSRTGEAQYSADNADYARYTQLMNRMLTGDLTEAEHAELLGLDKKNGSTKKELARRIDEGNATLRDILQHNALFEAYPEIAETKVKFADMPSGTAGSYNRETNTITLDTKLKYDANDALDALMHEVQHRVQAAEGFASGTNPGYWNRGENYDRAAEKYRDNRARLLNGLSTEDLALYNEYRSAEREMGAMLDGSMLYDESRMDALEKRSDELYRELYGKEWFGKLSRYDRILGDAGEAVKEFYRSTAGEIEARDTTSRRRMTAEERKNTPPDLGDADTVFADGNTMAAYAEANGNIRRNNIEYADNAARNAAQKALHDRMVSEGKTLDLTENREAASQYFPNLRSMPKAEKKGTGKVVMESRETAYVVDGKYSDPDVAEKRAARMKDEESEAMRAEEREALWRETQKGSPFEAQPNATTDTRERVTKATSAGVQRLFQQLISKGKTEVSTQGESGIRTYTAKMNTNGVEYWVDISDGRQDVQRFREFEKEKAAQLAAEWMDKEANRAYTAANEKRAEARRAELSAEENAKIAELFGNTEELKTAETPEDAPSPGETAESRVTDEIVKAEKSFRESLADVTHGAMRMFVNAGETVRRISKQTKNKSLEGYYFNAGAYSQRAGNWIAKGGARTDISGHKTGESLMDILGDIMKTPEKYKDFQLMLLHRNNVDRMRYDSTEEVQNLTKCVTTIEDLYPKLRGLDNDYLYQTAVPGDKRDMLSREWKETVLDELLNGEMPEIADISEAAQMLIFTRQKISEAKKNGLKPVFGYEVTAYDSQLEAERLLKANPEFDALAKRVYAYFDDLLQYRIDAGLDTQKHVDAMKKRYPNYVPTMRVEGTEGKTARRARRNGGIVVSNAIGRAVGGDAVIMPLHTAMSRKTVAVMKNAGLNQFGEQLVQSWNQDKSIPGVNKVELLDYSSTDQYVDSEELYVPVTNNVFSVLRGNDRYNITMDEGLAQALNAFQPDKYANSDVAKLLKKGNDLFKALCTGYNPIFMVRNLVRDAQDAAFYSTDSATWAKMFPSAWKQIVTNGEIWQQYKALGGSYASMLDYTTGMVKEPKSAAGKLAAKYESLGQAIEAAPRLAEFMTILANKGGTKTADGVKTGKFTQSDLMEAMLGAADITTNFARGGTVTKMLNKYLVPFLNPSVQGADKFVRNITDRKGFKAWASLAIKAAALGILPELLNGLLYRDDDEWDDIPDQTKSNYYLFKLGDGYWMKIPRGRALAVFSAGATYAQEKAKGNDPKFSDVIEVVKSNVAPTDIFNQNIATAWTQTKLFNPDNPGTTWYGGNIESDRLQNYRPGERYDEKTDELSKWIGKTFNLSPKKINYLLDQYSGVVGDLLLPWLTPSATASSPALAPLKQAFMLDSTSTNKTTGEYYDLLDDLKYDANDGDIGAGITRKYVSHAGDEVNDYYQQIRAIQSDENLTKAEKNRLVRALKSQLIERQKEIIAQAEPYREAVSDYLKAHPELSTDNDAAIAEYAELYGITEDQAESRMDAIVYREANREVFGAEYALRTYNADVYDKARAAYAKGVSYDTYYDYYFATKEMHADKDENGKSISGSKKAKVVEYINSLDIPPEQKDALYVAAGYTAKSARNQKWNGGSGDSGGRRGRGKRTALKAPTPKAPEIIIPRSGTASSAKAGGTSKTPKVSGNVIADFTKTASGTDIQKAVTQAKRKALKAGNRTVYVEEGSPIDYFLKYGKLPSLK